MRRVLIVLSGACLGLTLFISPTLAQRSEPGKAGKYQATLVTAYNACVAPNDTTSGALPLPACHPAVPSDSVCKIPTAGGGKAAAKADPAGDVALKLQLKGLTGCDGDTLRGVATVRVTTNQCASGDPGGCTVTDLPNFPVTNAGSCVLDGGKCKIKSTVNTEVGAGTLSAGHLTNVTINGVGLLRSTNVNGGTSGLVATSGLIIP